MTVKDVRDELDAIIKENPAYGEKELEIRIVKNDELIVDDYVGWIDVDEAGNVYVTTI